MERMGIYLEINLRIMEDEFEVHTSLWEQGSGCGHVEKLKNPSALWYLLS